MPNQSQYLQSYGVAIASVVIALLLMLALDPVVQFTQDSFLLFFSAVVISALYGGRNPGIVATVLSDAFANYFFQYPQYSWALDLASLLKMALFILEGVLISVLIGSLRTAQAQARKNSNQLQTTEAEIKDLNQALQRRVDELQTLFDIIPINIAIATDPDGRVIKLNSAFSKLLQLPTDASASFSPSTKESPPAYRFYQNGRELSRHDLLQQYVAKHGVELRDVEIDLVRQDNAVFSLYGHAVPLFDEFGQQRGSIGVYVDITERKRREANAAFLAEISADFSRLSTADEIMQTIGAKVGAYLNISNCLFAEIDESQDQAIVAYSWHTADMPEVIGTYRLSEFITEEFLQAARSGETVIIRNTQTDPRTDKDGYAAFMIHAFVTVPFHRSGEWKYLFTVNDSVARNWCDDEIELIREITNQIFPRLERARAEDALRKSEERLKLAMAAAQMGTWDMDLTTGKVVWSEEHFTMLGYEPIATGEASEQMWSCRLHPDDQEWVIQTWQQSRLEHQLYRAEYRVIRADNGQIAWLAALGSFTYDQTGQAVRSCGVLFDVTERKQAEALLRASRNTFHHLVENSPFGVYIVDADFRLVLVSAGAQKAFENVRPLIGRDFAEVLRVIWMEPFASEAIAHFRHTLQTGEPYHAPSMVEHRHDTNKVESYDWKIERITLPDGCFGVVCHFYDLSERQRYEAALRESEERLRLALMAADQGLYDLNVQTGDAIVSPEYAQLLGYKPDEFQETNAKWRDRLHPDDAAVVYQTYEDYIAGKLDIYRVEFRQRTLSGDWKWILSIGKIVAWDDAGQPLRMLGTHTDISDRKQGEAEREQLLQREQAARAEAERANRIKDEFLSILSHELRSPLNPILGWSKLLQTMNLDPAKTKEALATIERNAKLQTQLIDDLLDIARILRGKLLLAEASVNLVSMITAALEVVKTAAEAKSISLIPELSEVGQVRGDYGRLQQIVWNLLSNAIKFTPSGGRVHIQLCQMNNHAQLTVTDTGKGISPDFLPYIFESFRQENTSITRQHGGLGLGLSIVKYLVDAHGGTVVADSLGEGHGATFTIYLPLLKDELMLPTAISSSSAEVNLAGVKVLAVDDSEDARELLSTLLTQYGADARVFASGEELLQQLDSFNPNVLICDLGMPDMDGYTLLQQIRALPSELCGVPAIALTAYAREEERQHALDCGFQKHISKPLDPEILAIAITELTMR